MARLTLPFACRRSEVDAMPRRLSTFRQSDVARAVKAAQSAGLPIGKVEVAPDGTIRLIIADGGDSVADTPFDQWKAKHANPA